MSSIAGLVITFGSVFVVYGVLGLLAAGRAFGLHEKSKLPPLSVRGSLVSIGIGAVWIVIWVAAFSALGIKW